MAMMVIVLVAIATAATAHAQLASTDPAVSDGPCNFPPNVALNTDVTKLYDFRKTYFIPRASAVFFRSDYEILNGGQPAADEAPLAAMQPVAKFLSSSALANLGDIEVRTDEGAEDGFVLRCLPSNLLPSGLLTNPLAAFLNNTCTVAPAAGLQATAEIGTIYYQIIWSDQTAVTFWGCIHGRQMFKIMTTSPPLTAAQLQANDALLGSLGFSPNNYVDMAYD